MKKEEPKSKKSVKKASPKSLKSADADAGAEDKENVIHSYKSAKALKSYVKARA